MPPYCEEHQMYHDGIPGECQRMRAAARAEKKAAARQQHAVKIARAALDAGAYEPGDRLSYTRALNAATAAALQALTESETAR